MTIITTFHATKDEKIMNYLINRRVHKHDMNLIESCKLWKTVVAPAVLYGCQLWTYILKNLLEFEILQKITARRL